jgi:glycosyltransferase involved in cell wall biosynthesis
MEALSLNPSQRAILATRAMAHVAQHFTRERMADQTLNLYAELLQNRYSAFFPGHENLKSAAE